MHALLRKLLATARERDLFPSPGLAVVAVSSGPDSMALVHALRELDKVLGIKLMVAHLDHGLRDIEAVGDAAAVGELAGELGLPVEFGVRRVAPEPGESLEEAARELRYGFLGEIAARHGARYVAVGHTADDQAETLIMRLLRGAGPRGLQAMTPLSQRVGVTVVRPLLDASRTVVRSYLSDRQINFRLDRTNNDLRLLRNRIRRVLVPLLETEFNPGVTATLGRTAELMNEVDDHLTRVAEQALDAGVLRPEGDLDDHLELDLGRLSTYDLILRRYLLRQALLRLVSDLRGIGFDHIDALLDLTRGSQRSRRVDLPGGLVGLREGNSLSLWTAAPGPARVIPLTILPLEGRVELPEVGLEIRTQVVKLSKITADSMVNHPGWVPGTGPREGTQDRSQGAEPIRVTAGSEEVPGRAVFDLSRVRPPLAVRSRRAGDRILPFGRRTPKKVKDLLIDAKVPRRLRPSVPIIVDRAGEPEERILWVAGHRRSAHAPVESGKTEELVEVRLSALKS
jgi:tRNA(Ile)-lysidine synthase